MKQVLMAASVLLLSVSAHAGNGLPDSMVGQWCFSGDVTLRGSGDLFTAGQCRPHDDGGLTITKHSYHYHEQDCTLTNVRWVRGKTYIVDAQCSGEAMDWTVTKVFKLVGQDLHVETISQSGEDD